MRGHERQSAAQSRRAKAGARAEDAVDLYVRQAKASGVAWLERVPTQARVIGRTAKGELAARYVRKATVDYLGATGLGRPVALEVKHVRAGRLSLARVERHQRELLDWYLAHNGVAILVVVTSDGVHAVPWASAVGKTSMGPENWRLYRVESGRQLVTS